MRRFAILLLFLSVGNFALTGCHGRLTDPDDIDTDEDRTPQAPPVAAML